MTQTRTDVPGAAPHEGRAQGRLRKLLAEPLFHFFVVGAVVFGAYGALNPEPEQAAEGNIIEIDANDIRQIVVAWLAQGRPPLTPAQLQSLVEQKIADEVLFREGLALGLDRNDEIIKRRIAQKMDFLAADIAALQEPGKPELMAWYAAQSARFALPPRASFRQLYFSPDKRGDAARDDAAAVLDAIAGQSIAAPELAAMADPFMLRPYYSDVAPDQVRKEFGPDFAQTLFNLTPGGWLGPFQSGYGWHLVQLEALAPGRIPAFPEVEADVRSAWINDQYREVKRAAYEEMRARYTVNVAPIDLTDGDAPAAPMTQ